MSIETFQTTQPQNQELSPDTHFLSANATDTDSTPTTILPPTFSDTLPGANPNTATKQAERVEIQSSTQQPLLGQKGMGDTLPAGVAGGVGVGEIGGVGVVGGGGKARSTEGVVLTNKAELVKLYIRSLLLWEHPIQSALALTTLLGLDYALTYHSPVRVLAFLFGVATLANMVFVNFWVYGGSLFVNVNEKGGVKKPPTMWFLDHANRQPINNLLVREWVDFLVDAVNLGFAYLASIVAVDDNKTTFTALLATWALYTLSGYLSTSTLFALVTIASFSVPRLYLSNKVQIDVYLHAAADAISKYWYRYTEAISAYCSSAAARARSKVEEAKHKVKKHE